eukprot:CAMPEP_0194140552 /NCGR_PEP_ID=MMETSP0152-20130528/10088_1 /TAXON_ID=1049557 /ORGANISM="Thalassiothrix antarctica, Strain L6-D1" /LENGTH=957 /DNA_ID=CAMNT_0038838841 /DNA_START=36 /DNA_END=2912 /DNA_ORIENTATION=+
MQEEDTNEEGVVSLPNDPNAAEASNEFVNEFSLSTEENLDEYYKDEVKEMTRGRRIARHMSKRYACYDPSRKKEHLKLDEAWAHFEHSALPRYISNDNNDGIVARVSLLARKNNKDKLVKAEEGEREVKTKLYSVCSTPERELSDFGLGVGIYFWTLRITVVICLIAGCISIPNIMYFHSEEYDGNAGNYDGTDHSWLFNFAVSYSAVCTDTTWVPCVDCGENVSYWDSFTGGLFRYATTSAVNSEGLFFVKRNNCSVGYKQGLYAFSTLVFVVLSIIIMNLVSRRREVQLDESQQTTSDYSVQVSDPPKDAFDPEEWKAFFSQQFDDEHEAAEVVAVTVALNNERLIRTLVKRRQLIQNIAALVESKNIPFDPTNIDEMVERCCANDSPVPTWKKYLCCAGDASSPARKYLQKVRKLDEKARRLAQKKKEVSHVFVTFQTEKAQRSVLKALSRSGFEEMCSRNRSIPETQRFRGEHSLYVTEPKEPSTILWHNLDNTTLLLIFQIIMASAFVLVAIACGCYLIMYANENGSVIWATVTITAINQVIPRICYFLTSHEAHKSDGAHEASLYTKMTFFKWINTAVITRIITSSISTIDGGAESLPHKVYAIYFSELVINPSLLLMDIWGQIQRHYLGPRASTQEQMNLRFTGADFSLALRYKEITKILFLTFFYSTTFPGGFFFAAISLFTNYFVDKYCLLRSYGSVPEFGNSIAQLSRSYIFPAAFAVYSIMLSYGYAEFPYDNLCAVGDPSTATMEKYIGDHTIYIKGDTRMNTTVSVTENNDVYEYCDQDMISLDYVAFPAIPANQREGKEWMGEEQERIATLLGWTSVVVCAIAAIAFLRKFYYQTMHKFLRRTYKPVGKASDQLFTDSLEHYGYIPSVNGHQYPLLACNISHLDEAFLDWSDPSSTYPYDNHNLIYDIPDLSEQQIFSVIKTWDNNNSGIKNPNTFATADAEE